MAESVTQTGAPSPPANFDLTTYSLEGCPPPVCLRIFLATDGKGNANLVCHPNLLNFMQNTGT